MKTLPSILLLRYMAIFFERLTSSQKPGIAMFEMADAVCEELQRRYREGVL